MCSKIVWHKVYTYLGIQFFVFGWEIHVGPTNDNLQKKQQKLSCNTFILVTGNRAQPADTTGKPS